MGSTPTVTFLFACFDDFSFGETGAHLQGILLLDESTRDDCSKRKSAGSRQHVKIFITRQHDIRSRTEASSDSHVQVTDIHHQI